MKTSDKNVRNGELIVVVRKISIRYKIAYEWFKVDKNEKTYLLTLLY